MKIKNISLVIILLFLIFFSVFKYSYSNNKLEQSYYYFNMIESLKLNDKRNARFYAKQILNSSYKTVYYEYALLLMYEEFKEKKKNKKCFQFCEKFVKNRKLGLTNVIEECNKYLYKNSQ
ncbi:MAG TPA: hypothetical protein ACYCC3_00440 [Candidatus Azoamicus sp.]